MSRGLFGPGDPRRLAALRIGLAAIIGARLARGVYVELAGQPDSLFRPLSFMLAFGEMPPRALVVAIQAVGLAAAVLALVGRRARAAFPLMWACAVFLGGMTTSLGKVVHNDVLPLLAAVPLLAAHHSDVWSLDARRGPPEDVRTARAHRYGWPVHTAMIVVAGGYFFAGFQKLVSSGIAWVTSDSMRWIFYSASENQTPPNDLALWFADRPLVARAVAASILALELAFPLALVSRRARPVLLAGAVLFTVGIWATLRLNYWPWAATALVVFVNVPALLAKREEAHVARAAEPAVARYG